MATCPICNHENSYLIEHIWEEHSLTIDAFRKKYGFEEKLVDEELYDLIEAKLTDEKIQRQGNLTFEKFFTFQNLKLEKLPPNPNRPHLPELDETYLLPDKAKWVLMAIKERKNVFLTGLSGTGKSSLILQIYALLNRSLYHISSFGDLTYEHLIYKDELKTNPDTGNIETRPQYGMIIQSMLNSKNKAGLLFDEISFADTRVLQALQPLLEGSTRYLTIPETGEIIKAHPDWVFFATDNTKGQGDELGMFSGTENMNFALLNRFAYFLEIDYLPPKQEELVVQKKLEKAGVTLPKEIYSKAMKVTKTLRQGIKSNKYYMTFSIRDLYEWLLKLRYFDNPMKNLIECAQVTFVDKLDSITRQGVINVLEDIIG